MSAASRSVSGATRTLTSFGSSTAVPPGAAPRRTGRTRDRGPCRRSCRLGDRPSAGREIPVGGDARSAGDVGGDLARQRRSPAARRAGAGQRSPSVLCTRPDAIAFRATSPPRGRPQRGFYRGLGRGGDAVRRDRRQARSREEHVGDLARPSHPRPSPRAAATSTDASAVRTSANAQGGRYLQARRATERARRRGPARAASSGYG